VGDGNALHLFLQERVPLYGTDEARSSWPCDRGPKHNVWCISRQGQAVPRFGRLRLLRLAGLRFGAAHIGQEPHCPSDTGRAEKKGKKRKQHLNCLLARFEHARLL
jgi:hypothetical protein